MAVFGGVYHMFSAKNDSDNKMIAQGCEPTTWDRYGMPTHLKCPPGVTYYGSWDKVHK